MKKMLVAALALVLMASLVSAETKDIQKITGQATYSVSGKDSTGFVALSPWQISEMSGGAASFKNKKYNRIVGSCIVSAMVDGGDSIANENEVDSAIINYKFKTSWYTILAEADSAASLPCTTFFVIDDDTWSDYTESIYGDSTAATVKPKLTSDYAAFLMDQFYIEYYVADTAGSSGAMTGTVSYWFKFFEDE